AAASVPRVSRASSRRGRASRDALKQGATSGTSGAAAAVSSSTIRGSFPTYMAARGAGASSSARRVSAYRSRSNVRPSASVPENEIAIHRMPAAASATTNPSRTSAKANTSTHETAKNSVVERISKLLISTATSLRNTSPAVRPNILFVPHDRAVAGPQPRLGRSVGEDLPAPHENDARDQTVGEIEIVRGQ